MHNIHNIFYVITIIIVNDIIIIMNHDLTYHTVEVKNQNQCVSKMYFDESNIYIGKY